MLQFLRKCVTFSMLPVVACTTVGDRNSSPSGTQSDLTYYAVDDFESVEKWNTHVHINIEDTLFIKAAQANNFKLITVNVNPSYYTSIGEQRRVAVKLVDAFPERIAYATTFSLAGFNEADWERNTIEYLRESFAMGAVAVKVWKNIGLELRDAAGKFVQIDDPKFDRVLNFIEQNNATLIGHIGEPKNAWLPVEKMTVSGDKRYFSAHPEYHMYLHPEYPSHEEIMAARDRMLGKHPNLNFVGAHLGSLEWSVEELAARLDKYPNMAVDMAERISHFQYQAVTDWQKVRDFFIKYQDRLIYATDETVDGKRPLEEVTEQARENWLRHWRFFVSGDSMKVPKVETEFRGLMLPRDVVDKIYRKNAERWFPGLAGRTND